MNDTYGHEMGDNYICAMAEILRKVTVENELAMYKMKRAKRKREREGK